MMGAADSAALAAPATYQQWLDCFAVLKEQPLSGSGLYEVMAAGSFAGTGAMQAALQRQLADTVNVVLDRSAKRFIRELNACIAFQELGEAVFLFKRLKKDIHKTLFFMELTFLPGAFKAELYAAIEAQMTDFWEDTLNFLKRQALEYANSDLEDAIYLIKRIKLFS